MSNIIETLRRWFRPRFPNNVYELRFDGIIIKSVWCPRCAETMIELYPDMKLIAYTSERCNQCQIPPPIEDSLPPNLMSSSKLTEILE